MKIALEREEGIKGSKYSLVCIVNSALGNIVEEIRNNMINDKSGETYKVLISKQELKSTLNRIVKTTGLTRKPVSISTIDKKEENIFIDTYSYSNYIVTKNTTAFPQPNPSTITFTIKFVD